jgi:hypothetical protein
MRGSLFIDSAWERRENRAKLEGRLDLIFEPAGELEDFPGFHLHRVANADELFHCWRRKAAFNLRNICALAGHAVSHLLLCHPSGSTDFEDGIANR